MAGLATLLGMKIGQSQQSNSAPFIPGTITSIVPLQVTTDGALTPVNCIPPAYYSVPTVGDRVQVIKIGALLYVYNVVQAAAPIGGGVGGSGSDTLFTFATPSATWTISHGLGHRPIVSLIDSTGAGFDADLEYPDLNTVVATHAVPVAGFAVIT